MALQAPLPQDTVLLLIDIQQAFDEPSWGPRNNPDAEAVAARLLDAWRAAGRPCWHVRHNSLEPTSTLRPGQPGNAFKTATAPRDGEPVFEKTVNSAFIGTDLEERLRAAGHKTLVLVGLTTNHCVSTTARMAGNLGFDTYVVEDAVATFDTTGPDGRVHAARDVHAIALASLHGEFATVVHSDDILAP